MKKVNVAIDGPAGAGKSTVAKMAAEKLGFIYIDTGAMYRAVTWKALNNHVDPRDDQSLETLLKHTEIQLTQKNGSPRVICDGQDVTEQIRDPSVTRNVSFTASHRNIREDLVRRQQQLAAKGGTVMDGRDIGTAVLPDAEVKVFLTASVNERARRRYDEQVAKGIPTDIDELKQEIENRDKLDTEREVTPLKQAEDAVYLDSTKLSIEEVVKQIYQLAVKGADRS
ncbi:(d)CMP kinase [Salisediminibacterium beveridgei]|uniref:Cytidylate kinase n=1 Tax=Salisediminibacterium beveridgei TaxID=632773 RepID=A0A1D7QV01_9BACI|nr:(d)CMP kinase [Salisediminibacterium beveridgei]AOM82788.1 Cytidylate kinase [Salisediminibacterium beveridgei]